MDWINVKTKLPSTYYIEEDFDNVLITDGTGISIGYLDKENNTDILDKDLFDDICWTDEARILSADSGGWPNVTHWMPLPEPPEED